MRSGPHVHLGHVQDRIPSEEHPLGVKRRCRLKRSQSMTLSSRQTRACQLWSIDDFSDYSVSRKNVEFRLRNAVKLDAFTASLKV